MVVLDHGFRPFFFLAGAWSAIAVALWLAMLAGRLESPSALDPVSWHVHEMVFGFAAAAIGGFILTAIPNWTGRAPVAGGAVLGFGLAALHVAAVLVAWTLWGPEVGAGLAAGLAAVEVMAGGVLLLAARRKIDEERGRWQGKKTQTEL